jgi:hypothetical protein
MTSAYFEQRQIQKLENARSRLEAMAIGETLEINELEVETYRKAREQLPEYGFTARRVDHGHHNSFVLTRRK